MASNFNKAERYVKQGDEYKLLSYATSSESVKMTDGTDLQTKMNSVDAEIDTKIDSVKIGTTECKSGTTVTLPVYTKDETDSTFGADIALSIDTSTYKMTLELKDNKGQILSSKEIDFPIESMVVNASYANGTLTLTLQNGNDINVDISSIISGLVPDTRTIAGVDLKDNITATELRTALNVASGAEVNQNAFSNVKVGDTTISADAKTDTLTLVAGDNVTITPDATNDKVTIKATDTTYSNFVKSGSSAKAGLVPAPSTTAGTTKYLREDGTWAVPPDTNTTYTSLKNPYALTIQGNGTTLTNGTYDGSAAKTVNITPSSIGAAASSHTHSSYANQNAFSNVKVGSTTVAADTTTDTLELVAGSNVTITPDATNDKITIAATNTVYTHPTYTARTGKPTANQTPAFGGTATVSQITSDTTGHVTGATDRTITIPSTLSNGTGTAGLIKTTSTVTSNSGYTACPVISGVPYYKDTNTTYTHPSYTAKSNGFYKVTVDATGHVSGTTAVAKSDITALGIPAQDTTYSAFVKSGSGAKAGLVPAPPTTVGTIKYLREDGTWTVPPKTSIANNLTTTTTGIALDATQGKALNDKITTLNSNLIKYASREYSCPISTSGQQYVYNSTTITDITPSGHTPIGSMCKLINGNTEHVSNLYPYKDGWVATISDRASVGDVFTWNIVVFYI